MQILAQIARAMARAENRVRLADVPDAPALFAALKEVLTLPADAR